MKKIFNFLTAHFIYWPLRLLGLLPHAFLVAIANQLGTLIYYVVPKFRKRALSNLSLAKELNLSEKALHKTAKKSLQNLCLTLLEYGYLARKKTQFKSLIENTTPHLLSEVKKTHKSAVFFCPHFANWEIGFLDLAYTHPSIAIGKPIKNKTLYSLLTSIREMTGGTMIEPIKALPIATKALKEGICVGLVADQGMQESSYTKPFLGRIATNTTAPALLAYKTNTPLIVGTTLRKKNKMPITYHPPIYPDTSKSLKEEVKNMMDKALKIVEDVIKKEPYLWLWTHNRWKMPTTVPIKKRYRYECFLIVLPNDPLLAEKMTFFERIYPHHFITVAYPNGLKQPSLKKAIFLPYRSIKDLLKKDYRYKMVFDFTNTQQIKAHFNRLSMLTYLNLEHILKKSHLTFKQFLDQFDTHLNQFLKDD
jgi:KDO2-lipid IV(A) lauroyltransferase